VVAPVNRPHANRCGEGQAFLVMAGSMGMYVGERFIAAAEKALGFKR